MPVRVIVPTKRVEGGGWFWSWGRREGFFFGFVVAVVVGSVFREGWRWEKGVLSSLTGVVEVCDDSMAGERPVGCA